MIESDHAPLHMLSSGPSLDPPSPVNECDHLATYPSVDHMPEWPLSFISLRPINVDYSVHLSPNYAPHVTCLIT